MGERSGQTNDTRVDALEGATGARGLMRSLPGALPDSKADSSLIEHALVFADVTLSADVLKACLQVTQGFPVPDGMTSASYLVLRGVVT